MSTNTTNMLKKSVKVGVRLMGMAYPSSSIQLMSQLEGTPI